MVIISDTSPLTALLLSHHAELLPALFARVVIPPAVESEPPRAHSQLPSWIQGIAETASVIHKLRDKGSCWFGYALLVNVREAAGEAWS